MMMTFNHAMMIFVYFYPCNRDLHYRIQMLCLVKMMVGNSVNIFYICIPIEKKGLNLQPTNVQPTRAGNNDSVEMKSFVPQHRSNVERQSQIVLHLCLLQHEVGDWLRRRTEDIKVSYSLRSHSHPVSLLSFIWQFVLLVLLLPHRETFANCLVLLPTTWHRVTPRDLP